MPGPRKEKKYGLLANGYAGSFGLELDQSLGKSENYYLEIQAVEWSFRFRLPDCSYITRIRDFLQSHNHTQKFSEFRAGFFSGAPVVLAKDDEIAGRFFLKTHKEGEGFNFVLAAKDVESVIAALNQVIEDLR